MDARCIVVVLLLLSCFAAAENHYVTQAGNGSRDGSTPANAWSVAQFNTAGNWDSYVNSDNGKIGPGDTVFFSGRILSSIEPQGSGTAGNYVTLDGYEGGKLNPVKDHITFSGVHVGQNRSASLTTTYANWVPNYLVGTVIWNWKDRSKCVVQSNSANTASCVLSGGTRNSWNHGDWYTIQGSDIDLIPGLPPNRAILYPGIGSSVFSNAAAVINDKHHIIIQDFEIDGEDGLRYHGIYTLRGSNIIIRRNYIHDVANAGIENDPDSSNHVPDHITIGGANGDGNFLYNCQYEQSVPQGEEAQGSQIMSFGNDLVISYNELGEFWQYPDSSAHTIQIFTGDRLLMEYNTLWWSDGQAAICPKENYRVDAIIRANKIIQGGNVAGAISISTTQQQNRNFWVYGNAIFSSGYGIRTYKDYDGIYVFSNIMSNIENLALWVGGRSTGDDIGLTRWYNNAACLSASRSEAGSSSGAAMRINLVNDAGGDTPDARIENNIFMNSDTVTGEYDHLYMYPNVDQYLSSLDYNTYYNGNKPSRFYQYGLGRLDFTALQARGWEANGNVKNPGFIDPDGQDNVIGTPDDDLRLDGTAIDDGHSHSESSTIMVQGVNHFVSTSLALDPDRTDWTTTPPTVAFADQNAHGTGWERGAYVYILEDRLTECRDNIDNDGDGRTDLADTGCTGSSDDDESDCGDGKCESGESCAADCMAGKQYAAKKATKQVQIDGDLREFEMAEAILISNTRGTKGVYKLLWDNAYLYVAASVNDTQLNALGTERDSAIYSDDSLELFFDTLADGGNSMNSNDFKVLVSIRNTQSDSRIYDTAWNSQMESAAIHYGTLNAAGADNGYSIEARIPLYTLGSPGIWGFDNSMNDRDDSGSHLQTSWSNSDGGTSNNPSGWGRLIFTNETASFCSEADADNNIQVSIQEIKGMINQWRQGNIRINSLMTAINEWKNGC